MRYTPGGGRGGRRRPGAGHNDLIMIPGWSTDIATWARGVLTENPTAARD
ncbi:hypothetical protein [Nocardia wallacei]|nr:hypothetical protein [Nocardia wallacei]